MVPFTNEELVGEALAPLRDQVVIATKFRFASLIPMVDRAPEHALDCPDQSSQKHVKEGRRGHRSKRLKTDVIDLFYQHRVDPNVPIEDVAGAVKEPHPARQGEALSDSRKPACRLSVAQHAVQPGSRLFRAEYSLWSREA